MELVGSGHAAANCQLSVLARPVLLLAVEDGLGLATLPASEPFRVPATKSVGADASCEILVGVLDVSGLPPTVVTGPALVGAPLASFTAGETRGASLAGENAFASCQRVVLAGALVIGGGAYGLRPGLHDVIDLANVVQSGQEATCRVEIAEIRVAPSA